MDTASIDLHRLPRETLHQIAGHLADSHRPSLDAFGLTSKAYHEIATSFIFRHLHLTIRSPKELQRDVNALEEALSRTDSCRHVNTLNLQGYLDTGTPRDQNHVGPHIHIDPLGWWESTLVDEPRINTIIPNAEPIHRGEYITDDEPVIQPSSQQDTAWAPVVRLIKMLPALSKLVYDCPNQFPPCLFDALHDHPRCQLQHMKFRLRTLLSDKPNPYELALATSPRLSSAKLYCTYRDSAGADDFNQDAMMELAAGLAPNLKEVTVVKFTTGLAGRYSHESRETWRGLPGYISDGSLAGSLTSLSLLGTVNLCTPALLQKWTTSTDFSCLRHLALGGEGSGFYHDHVNGVNGEVMAWVAQNCSLAQLKVLHLVIERDSDLAIRADYGDNAVSFFTALAPLEELSVTGPLEPEILDAILSRHGQTLEKLSLHAIEDTQGDNPEEISRHEIPMIFTKEHVQQIQISCPVIQHLAIPVKRMQSSAVEVEMYKSLASIQSITSLFIILDCSDLRVGRDNSYGPDPSFDEDDLEIWGYGYIKKGHLRVALINSAVDETLARSIWDTIVQHKAGKKLQSLKLWTTGGGKFGNDQPEATSIFAVLSRSWLITRLPRNDKELINVTEQGKRTREATQQQNLEEEVRWKKSQKMLAHRKMMKKVTAEELKENPEKYKPSLELTEEELGTELDSGGLRIFRRIWPRNEDSRGWREDWTSFPLEV